MITWRIYLFCLLLLVSACTKFVQVDPPDTAAEQTRVFTNDADAVAAATGVYYQLAAYNLTFCNGAVTFYGGLSSDEFINTDGNTDETSFASNNLTADNSVLESSFWASAYKNIYHTNAVLEGLESSNTISTPVKEQLRGEMLFTRSLLYFYLVNFFGDVPLVLSTDYTASGIMPRTLSDSIYSQITSDLQEAIALLRNKTVKDNQRPSAAAAAALLARVYLYRQQWAPAVESASYVIDSCSFSLEKDLSNVFLNSSSETIFQLSRSNANTAEGQAFIPYASFVPPACTVSDSLMAAFEPGDKRRDSWLQASVINGTTYHYPYKYKVWSSPSVTEYYVVLRLAEQYLIRAEAKLMAGDLKGSASDLNVIRQRAGLSAITDDSKDALQRAMQQERRIELFAEWAHRWFDLKRWNLCDEVLGPMKSPGWQSSDTLYPIPLQEMQLNPLLTQNAGY